MVLALLLTACGGGSSGEERGLSQNTETTEELGDPVVGGEFTIALEADSNSFLPSEAQWASGGYAVAAAIYDPLMSRADDGELKPYLAESLEPNEDLSRWTLKLRDGVTFHDGSALTAEVMKAIFDEYLTAPGSQLTGVLAGVSMEVVDPLTVTYVLPEPSAAFPDLLQYAAGMPFSIDAARAAGPEAGSRPVGTGAFKFVSWARDSELVVEKNPDYWREGLPYLDRVVFRPIPDEDSRNSSLLSGEVDAVQSLRGSSIKELQDAESQGFVAHLFVGNTTGASIMNVLEPPFDDVRVRKAFAMASNSEDVAVVLGDDGLVGETTQWFSEDSPWWSQRVADAYPEHDPDAARDLLQEYIDDPARSDGKAVGTAPSFTYDCLPDATLLAVAQLVQQVAEDIGFEVELSQAEQAAHITKVIGSPGSSPAYRGDFQAACWRLGDENDPHFSLAEAPGSVGDPAGQANVTNFSHPEFAGLFDQLKKTAGTDERKAIVEEIGILINENVPVSFGVGTAMMVGAKDSVKNVMGWTLPDGSLGSGIPNAVPRVREIWIDES